MRARARPSRCGTDNLADTAALGTALLMSSDFLMLAVVLYFLHRLVLFSVVTFLLFFSRGVFYFFLLLLVVYRISPGSLGSDRHRAIGKYSTAVLDILLVVVQMMSFKRSIRGEFASLEGD